MAERRRVVAIVQARMGSTRLPGKALTMIEGRPMLERVLLRLGRARSIDNAVVATTIAAQDDEIVKFCRAGNYEVSRGSQDDVLDRYRNAAAEFDADVVVRITSDCPLIDPQIIDQTVAAFAKTPSVDYAANVLEPRTFPRGLDVEVMSRAALEKAWNEDSDPASREHVTPYIYQHPDRFKLRHVENDRDDSALRWTVDTPADLLFVKEVYRHFGTGDFAKADILELLAQRPELSRINADVQQKTRK